MRTHGTITEVFEAAKNFYNETAEDGKPVNPEVRWNGKEWSMESGLNSAEDVLASCRLDEFDDYFYQGYQATGPWEISKSDERDFLDMISAD
jgi:hypothetical protein